MKKIIKVNNFEGYWFNCAKCGRKIKHAYTVDGSKEVFGSECVCEVSGMSYDNAAKQIKNQKSVAKILKNYIEMPEVYGLETILKNYNMTIEQYSNFCFEKGAVKRWTLNI